jgi:hypothetical protein
MESEKPETKPLALKRKTASPTQKPPVESESPWNSRPESQGSKAPAKGLLADGTKRRASLPDPVDPERPALPEPVDFAKPETGHLVLKPRVVVPTDKPAGADEGLRISVPKIHQENLRADERRTKGKRRKAPALAIPEKPSLPAGFKHRDIEVFNQVARPTDDGAISVGQILLENRIADEKSGWGRLKRWRRRKSRRGRDFIIVVGTVDITVALMMKIMPSPMMLIYGLGAITLVTTTMGWIMFFVMDPY